MTHPDHLADDLLSELVDGQLSPQEVSRAQAHLATCLACRTRLDDTRTLVGLLHALPTIKPPRDFQLGPRRMAEPPNVVRLRRWYAAARTSAGALAATFVFLLAGTLYLDSRQVTAPSVLSSSSNVQRPAPAVTSAAEASTSTGASAPAAAVPRAPAPAPPAAARNAAPAAAGAAAQSQTLPSPSATETGDQIAAATSIRPLPTQVPTPTLVIQPPVAVASAPSTSSQTDPAAPLRLVAVLVGVLAALGVIAALLIRHRLHTLSPSHLE